MNDVHPETEILGRLKTAIAACDGRAAAESTDTAVREGIDPLRSGTPSRRR